MMEAKLHRHWNGHEAFERWHVFHVRAHVLDQQVRILPRFGIVAVHRRTHGDEVQVVAVIHHRINALHSRSLDVGTVDLRRFLVGLDCSFIVAGANVNMRGHVHDVSRSRSERSQLVGTSEGALGRSRSLHGMDVIVNRSQMIGVALHHRLECRYDFLRAGLGRAIDMPQAPGMQIHASLGKKSGGIEVVRKFADHLPHGIAIIFGSLFQIRIRIGRKPLGQRLNVGLIAG